MFFLAFKHLFARKRQTFLTLSGIIFGAAAYVIISGLLLGFRAYLIDQLINNDAHIRVSAREQFLTEHSLDESFFGKNVDHVFWSSAPSGRKDSARINDVQGWYRRLNADSRVQVYSPQLTTQVLFRRAKVSTTGRLIGCDASRQRGVTNIEQYMKEGKFTDIRYGGKRMIAGRGLLNKVGAHIGETLTLSVGQGVPTPFRIVGIFETGVKNVDDFLAYASLADVQQVNLTPAQITDIAVRIVDVTQARALANSWSTLTQEKVQSWDEINASFFNVFKIQDFMRYLMTGTILVVAGFGIYNILNMTVTQKRRDVAILRSMGFESSDVVSLFFLQGLVLGIVGSLMGSAMGYFISCYLTTLPFGGGPLGGSGTLNFSFAKDIYVFSIILPLLASVLASVLPARMAGKLSPIEIIRQGAE